MSPALLLSLLVALVIMTACMWAYGTVWWLAAGAKDFAPWVKTQRVYARANIAKYVPGNVFQYIGRYQLAISAGMPQRQAALSIALESLVMILAALLVAGLGYLWSPAPLAFLPDSLRGARWLLALGAVVAAVVYWQRQSVFNLLRTLRDMVTPQRFLSAMILNIIIFAAIGGAVTELASAFAPATAIGWLDYTWGFAIAWVLGFLVPGAPGGLGVREAVLFALFAPRLGGGSAAMLFLVFRLTTTLADALVFGLSFVGRPLGGSPS